MYMYIIHNSQIVKGIENMEKCGSIVDLVHQNAFGCNTSAVELHTNPPNTQVFPNS